uniref:Uncharacterized protein n=2 Tax=Grateloupia TaxID=31454 RepID=A0A6F8UM03_9FLOR|nr:hypothetical protein Grafi_p091 [Grateloupia filicina]AWD77440.1 hypothetical protein Grafi_p091 [Grateloupia filicina]BCB14986.1 hypothetical protein [Grateloupia asiatica]
MIISTIKKYTANFAFLWGLPSKYLNSISGMLLPYLCTLTYLINNLKRRFISVALSSQLPTLLII